MPPRRSARVAAVAERASIALPILPRALVLDIFARLPVDERARCMLVCRGWHTTLTDVSLWARLDLSRSSGVRAAVPDDVLRGASGLARGALTALDVSGFLRVTHEALLAVVAANAGALTELRVCNGASHELPYDTTEVLLRAAPRLRVLHADVSCTAGAQARALLRNEPPFGPLRVSRLAVADWPAGTHAEHAAAVTVFGSDLSAHAGGLSSLCLIRAPFHVPAALNAFMDALLMRRVRSLISCSLISCRLSPASAPELVRLLSSDALTELQLHNEGAQLLNAPAAALLGEALRANSTLTSLTIASAVLWADLPAATALLAALMAHRSLRSLQFHNAPPDAENALAAGAALGALVAANAPALTALDVTGINSDVAARPLLRALLRNTHLRDLNFTGYDLSDAFAREVLLPAVRANTSLRALCVSGLGGAAFCEARALVAARAAAEDAH
jgi:hypothetical protein